MAVKITDISISCDSCLDETPLLMVTADDTNYIEVPDKPIQGIAPKLQFESVEDLIQYIKDNGGVYVGSRSLEVGTEESDYDFIVNADLADEFMVDYELHGYSVDFLSGDYPDLDEEVFGRGFISNFKVYYYGDDGTLYTLNFFSFEDEDTIRKYQVLQDTMLSLPKDAILEKDSRVKHFAHIQYVLGISKGLDVPYDTKLFAEYSGKLAGKYE